MLCISFSFIGCSTFYCDPKGKDWYNLASLPSIYAPFNEVYDGSYYIKIDKNGEVIFKPLNGEEIKGTVTTYPHEVQFFTCLTIQFENGKVAGGTCKTTRTGRSLSITYDRTYQFTDKRQLSKEEVEGVRHQFIDFLSSVYQTGVYPTQQEIATNSLYRQFTNYHQIDPCCGGPIVYDIIQRATIIKIEPTIDGKAITLSVKEETITCLIETNNFIVASINNNQIIEMIENDITPGDCLVQISPIYESDKIYEIYRIFYLNNI